MSWSNYDAVLDQLRGAGLVVDHLEVGAGIRRCAVEGDRERRGWYALHELRLDDGDLVIVGSFGIWQGTQNNAQRVSITARRLTDEQRAALKARISADRKAARARRREQAERAATRAARAWRQCSHVGRSEYLERKGVLAHGLRFSPAGNLVIPMCNAEGHVRGLQVIYDDPAVKARKGRDRDYWPAGLDKVGSYHLIGSPASIVLVAEGYATAATIYEATGIPIAVAFDAGNLRHVAEALAKTYRGARVLVCADDDYVAKCPSCNRMTEVEYPACTHCEHVHGRINTGVDAATSAALSIASRGAWVMPRFGDRGGKKLTDYNDLMALEGLHVVRAQIEARLGELGWRSRPQAVQGSQQGGGDGRLKSVLTIDEACERFTLIYGGKSTIYDGELHMLVPKADVLDILPEQGWRDWKARGDQRKIALLKEVGFDPGGQDPQITCNLWGGWPTEPRAGSCDRLLELLAYLCSGEENHGDIYRWVLRWLAYPIQHPGAKMRTALVFHGPQGVGKNLLFESVMSIYGEYGRIIDQAAIEDKFNDWASRKLFLIADEVVARQELFHTKNKLKSLISSDWIRINPKNVTAYEERNHVNLVFLSNETQPLILERDDRRYAVVWTPPKLSEEMYREVKEELDAGGAAALHDYLLKLELGDFASHTNPPMTRAKSDLIELGKDTIERFAEQWLAGALDPVPVVPVRSADLYRLYREWCARQGYPRYAPEVRFSGEIGKRAPIVKQAARYMSGAGTKQARFIIPHSAEQPAGQTQPVWLSQCMERFEFGVEEWKRDG